MISDEQFEKQKKYREHFLKTGEIHKDVRPIVAASWQRSRAYEVDPNPEIIGNRSYKFLPDGEVKHLLEENKQLLDIAYPVMLRVIEYIEGTQYAITLHDKNGKILCHLYAGDNPDFYSSSAGFNMGAVWDEKNIGTCAPYLSTLLDRDIMLIGHEHYSGKLCNLACIAAPIHWPSGEVIASVNMIGDHTKSDSHTLALVKETALLIQARLKQKLSMLTFSKVFNLMPDGLVLLGEKFQALYANQKAAAILKVPQDAVLELDFRKILKKENIWNLANQENTSITFPDYELNVAGRKIVCGVTISPVIEGKKNEGTLIALHEHQKREGAMKRASENQASYRFEDIISRDAGILSLKRELKEVCDTDHYILIEGESGTGKELFAQAIHSESNRASGPFIAVNCGSLPRSLVESELFGYDKGAFTGARSEGSPGKFELADGGTLFLDEVGELPLEVQATLLRVLDNHRTRRIGGRTEKFLDIHVVAATNRNLYREVQNGNFRSDLYFRLSVLKYDIPPLRNRGTDVQLLADRFLEKLNIVNAQKEKSFSEDFYDVIGHYSWPGNVRQLQNVVARSYYASQSNTITASELPAHILDELAGTDCRNEKQSPAELIQPTSVKDFERMKIIEALKTCSGNVVDAGRLLGFSKSTIYRRIREYNIKIK